MKSAEMFWNIIGRYNYLTIYFQIAMVLTGGFITGFLVWDINNTGAQFLQKFFLSLSFLWMSLFYFFIVDMTTFSHVFSGPLFAVIGFLFLMDIIKKNIIFAKPNSSTSLYISIFFMGLILAYPVISYISGKRYPGMFMPFMPEPVSVYTIIILIPGIESRENKSILLLLLIWMAVSLPRAIVFFGAKEDIVLFMCGVYLLFCFFSYIKGFRKITEFKRIFK